MNSMICPYCGKLITYNSFFDVFYCSKCGGFFKQATVMECNDLNKPLTLDELRKMDGEPVWVVYGEDAGMWALVEVCEESIFLTNNLGGRTEYADDMELEDDGVMVLPPEAGGGTQMSEWISAKDNAFEELCSAEWLQQPTEENGRV